MRCTNGLGHCIIDLQYAGYNAFIFQTRETRSARLEGMKIINPSIQPIPPGLTSPPAPIMMSGAGPTIELCEIDLDAAQAPTYSLFGNFSGPNVVYLAEGSSPLFQNCRILSSSTAFVVSSGSVATLDTCVLDGGNVVLDNAIANLDDCVISNSIVQGGSSSGAVLIENSSGITLTNCAITHSRSTGIRMLTTLGSPSAGSVTAKNVLIADCAGAGIVVYRGPATIINSTMVNNNGGIVQTGTATAVVKNSIIRGAGNQIISSPQSLVQVSYSDVQGGWPGTGNIDVDAMFVDAANGDYHLQQDSPCIDAGDSNASGLPSTDFDGGPRFVDDASVPDTGHNHGALPIDMGAYEFADCNNNGVDDAIDIQQGISLDCNLNGVPDDCDLSSGFAQDCNANNIPDSCDIATDLDPDCQHNGIPDSCDIGSGISLDVAPADGIPDECAFMAPVLVDPTGINKSRYISIQIPGSVTAAAADTALQVKLVSLMHPDPPNLPQFPAPNFAAYEGQVRWVGPVTDCLETESPPSTYKCAMLQCSPNYKNWSGALAGQTLHVAGIEVIPSSAYDVRQFAASCQGNEGYCTAVSSALRVNTGRWGDVIAPFQSPSPAALTQPNISDVAAVVDKFKAVPTAIIAARCDVNPAIPNGRVDIADVANIVDGFKNLAYPLLGPSACP
ncbi:MAG: right-handed parallel beta-helix repeat-containing protein [Planctomycetes bacterium]|nr:right-handed parallel beta-helix repeat-containing protein [Planctomycetota bacterium]MBI3836281.1 right-handed parallel beta-helix repeat-containing protein [Planctomycetota bacterium]